MACRITGGKDQLGLVAMRSDRIALEQLDRNAFRRAQEGNPHARPHRGRLLSELDALALELGDKPVDAADREPEVVETLIWRHRRRIDAVARRHRRDEDVGAAELEVNAGLALLHGADHLGPKHALVPLGGRLGIGGSQMDVVPSVLGHGSISLRVFDGYSTGAGFSSRLFGAMVPMPSSAKISSLCCPSAGGAESMRGPPCAKVKAARGTPKPPSSPGAAAWR